MSQKYDAIVIGSGMGGLTTATLLTQLYKKKVLVLEAHSKPGGFTHAFGRPYQSPVSQPQAQTQAQPQPVLQPQKVTWDVGLHYVGQMNEGGPLRKVMDKVTGGTVKWRKLASPHQFFMFPGMTMAVPSSPAAYKQQLIEKFPTEAPRIEKYFVDIKRAPTIANFFMMLSQAAPVGEKILRKVLWQKNRLAHQTVEQYFSSKGFSRELSGLLDAQWGDYGLPASECPFYLHAAVVSHYLQGAYYPLGSSQSIGWAAAEVIKAGGGELRVRTEAKELILDGDKVVGVRSQNLQTKEWTEDRASLVISNIGAINTYEKLVPPKLSETAIKEIAKLPEACTCVCAYIVLKDSPVKLGYQDQVVWIYDTWDSQEVWKNKSGLLKKSPLMAFVSFAGNGEGSQSTPTAQIVSVASYQDFKKWEQEPLRKRGEDYETLKRSISEGLIDFVEKRIPGFKEQVAFVELSTPLTVTSYSRHPKGMIYGIPLSVDRRDHAWIRPKTPVKGLYLTGADIAGPGIAGAMMSGLVTLSQIQGMGVFRKAFT